MPDIHTREFITSRLKRPIALVGMMGSGKSTLGISLARLLDCPFYDSDKVIEKEAGKTISEIFQQDGEAVFRGMEHDTIDRLVQQGHLCVIATGGGSITVPATADLVFGKTLSIWIDAPLDLLVSRTGRQKNRPLLKGGDPATILAGLLEKRSPLYRQAAIHTASADIPATEIAELAMRQINDYLIEHTI